jgi:hypothetical protein
MLLDLAKPDAYQVVEHDSICWRILPGGRMGP